MSTYEIFASARELEEWIKQLKCSESTLTERIEDLKLGDHPSAGLATYVVHKHVHEEEMEKIAVRQLNLNSKEFVQIDGESVEGDNKGNELHNGKLEGEAIVTFQDRRHVEGFFRTGSLHGFARYFDSKGQLTFVGQHEAGQPTGTCWKIVPGGGCVVGRVDSAGSLTGTNIAYIYPDFATALIGEFRDGVMENAQEACIIGMDEEDVGIKVPIFSIPTGHVHVRQISTLDHICSG